MPLRHRVLVVDDEPGIQLALADFLEFEGYEVRSAGDGRAALDVLASWRPDAILLDMMMPVMDGAAFRDAQRTLLGGLDRIPLILLSGARDPAAQAAAIDASVCIAKPFDLDDVLAALEQSIVASPSAR